MKVLIAGAGAIGGYIGARLAQAGVEVVLFARGPHLQAMRERGLRVRSPDGDFEVRPNVTGDLSSCEPANRSADGRCDLARMGRELAHGPVVGGPVYMWGVQ